MSPALLLFFLSCTTMRVALAMTWHRVLFCASQDDGAIRVWKNFADLEKNPEMVTAWQGLSDMLPTTRGRSPTWRLGGQRCVDMVFFSR